MKGNLITSGIYITSSTEFPWDHEDHDSMSALINQTVATTPPVQTTTGLLSVPVVGGSTVIPGEMIVSSKPNNVNIYKADSTEFIAPVVFIHREQARMNSSVSLTFNISGPHVSYLNIYYDNLMIMIIIIV